MRDLDLERRRLKGARERIMLRETQLRAFYCTTEEIKMLFAKQQEQLKVMQRTLQDEENHDNTERHDCDVRSQDDDNTQEAEFPIDDVMIKGGFGSDIDGVGTAPIFEGDADGTELVPETKSPGIDGASRKSGNLAGDTIQLEEDTNMQETEHNSEEEVKAIEDTEEGGTAPSMHGDDESPDNNEREAHAVMNDVIAQVAESQSTPSAVFATRVHSDHERHTLSNMIGIMAPDVKEQFMSAVGRSSQERNTEVSDSESETDDECVEASKNVGDADGGSGSDDETHADDQADGNEEDEDDDATQEDAVG